MTAAKEAGLTEVPTVIKLGLDDDSAKLIVTESNLVQRSFADLSYSERAISLKMQMDSIKQQGKRLDLINEVFELINSGKTKENETSGQFVQKLYSRDLVAEKYNLDARTVSRYYRLSELIKPLLDRLDNGEIPFMAAVSLSYLKANEQELLEGVLAENSETKITLKNAPSLRNWSEKDKLSLERIKKILLGHNPQKKTFTETTNVKIPYTTYQKYFAEAKNNAEIAMIIDKALQKYFDDLARENEQTEANLVE
jgi:ParB family chromosome partitioning protein